MNTLKRNNLMIDKFLFLTNNKDVPNIFLKIYLYYTLGQIPVKYPIKIPKTNSNNLQTAKTPYQKNGVKSSFPQPNKNSSKFYFAFKSRHSDH